MDSTSHATGSAGQFINIPDLKKQHVALTTPLIDYAAAPSDTLFNTVSSALREFRAGDRVAFAFRIETDSHGSLPAGRIDTQVQLYRDRTAVLNAPVPVVPARGQDGRAFGGELRLSSSLPAGQYYLLATAIDHRQKVPRSVSSWTEFRVVE